MIAQEQLHSHWQWLHAVVPGIKSDILKIMRLCVSCASTVSLRKLGQTEGQSRF